MLHQYTCLYINTLKCSHTQTYTHTSWCQLSCLAVSSLFPQLLFLIILIVSMYDDISRQFLQVFM